MLFTLKGWDLDAHKEIGVRLNGGRIGYLSRGPNDAFNGGDAFVIKNSQLLSGTNEILLYKRKVGDSTWGVKDLLLTNQ